MGFYDNYNFEGLKFFSKIKENPSLAEPCAEVIQILKLVKNNTPRPVDVAEIGIGYGATLLQILNLLSENDVYYCFDYQDTLQDLKSDLESGKFDFKCTINAFGNSHDEWDSYNWNLSSMIFDMRKKELRGIFDVVYLDGTHAFLYDGLAICMLKELIKTGGFLILDDLGWTFSGSKWGQNFGVGRLPKFQMDDMQILRAQEIFLRNDPFFEKLSDERAYRGVFRKVADYPSR